MITYDKALNVLAERVYDINEKQRQSSLQRRNQTVDLYGYIIQGKGTSSTPASIPISISQDMIYYARFEFKIIIKNSNANTFRVEIAGVDLTPYFKAQFNGVWLSSNGVYPNKGTSNFDVLGACGYMTEEERNKVLSPGYKGILVYGNGNFDVDISMYLKYAHTNR